MRGQVGSHLEVKGSPLGGVESTGGGKRIGWRMAFPRLRESGEVRKNLQWNEHQRAQTGSLVGKGLKGSRN